MAAEPKFRNKRIGDILLERGTISREQLEIALQRQKADNRLLGAILVDMGIPQERVAQALAEQRRDSPEITADALRDLPKAAVRLVPETLARRFNVIAVRRDDNVLTLAMEDPSDLAALDLLSHVTGCNIEPVKAPAAEITGAINRYYAPKLEGGQADHVTLDQISLEAQVGDSLPTDEPAESDLAASADETPVVQFVEVLFREAVQRRASDVHIEPGEQTTNVRLRVDGMLHRLLTIPRRMHAAVVSRIKIVSGLNIAERRLPQDGRCRLKLPDGEVDIRVSTMPTVHGEKVVMRLLDKGQLVLDLESRGMTETDLEKFKEALRCDHGMVLLSGPTGSGKTTTLYAALSFLNDPKRNIMTVEDPVEYELPGIGQVPVRPDIGLTFAKCLRHILRQDPNIILVGEMRDHETTQIAVRGALTGHLVLSTLHANNATGVISRLLDIGIPPYLITASLKLTVGQRLVRRLCATCKEPYEPSREMLESLKCDSQLDNATFYRAPGCEACDYTGYRGRVGIFELMPMSPRIKQMILNGHSEADLRIAARQEGMKPLHEQGIEKVAAGVTSIEEIASVPAEETGNERQAPLPVEA